MLVLKNLKKVYKSKGGVITKALDDVSVEFPEKGLVFLLGKSGSGKSTLLNMAGGLDKPDSGEIIVKGKSSKDFTSADFDSYRNTFIGFIFQEYNILDEFNVEDNISLALQLQGKKADKKAVNALLEQVDLKGFNRRKPNTLSGGQKQRIAIARALIKNPEIIMADEPTGALDSRTGAQVFDTLKKLSKDKLIIVVSHDRDFAEIYADRIIELKDGKIIEDVTKTQSVKQELSSNVNMISPKMVQIKDVSKLTETEFRKLYAMLKDNNKEVIISTDRKDISDIKKACKVTENGSKEYFKNTEASDIKLTNYNGKDTKFIKSTLPSSRAWKMGMSSLGSKKVRLFFTCLLSTVAFAMFGIVSTMMFYDGDYSVGKALETDNYYNSWLVGKEYKCTIQTYKINNATGEQTADGTPTTSYNSVYLDDEDINNLNNNNVGLKFAGVYYNNSNTDFLNFDLKDSLTGYSSTTSNYYNFTTVDKFVKYDADYFNEGNNFKLLAGKYPQNDNEVAIGKYQCELIQQFGFDSTINENGGKSEITSENNLLGKKLKYSYRDNNYNTQTDYLTISGIYDNGADMTKFNALKESDLSSIGDSDKQDTFKSQFKDVLENSFQTTAIVSDKFIEDNANAFVESNNGNSYIDGYTRYINSSWSETAEMYGDNNKEVYGQSMLDDSVFISYPDAVSLYDTNGNKVENADFTNDKVYINASYNGGSGFSNLLMNLSNKNITKYVDYQGYSVDANIADDATKMFYVEDNDSYKWVSQADIDNEDNDYVKNDFYYDANGNGYTQISGQWNSISVYANLNDKGEIVGDDCILLTQDEYNSKYPDEASQKDFEKKYSYYYNDIYYDSDNKKILTSDFVNSNSNNFDNEWMNKHAVQGYYFYNLNDGSTKASIVEENLECKNYFYYSRGGDRSIVKLQNEDSYKLIYRYSKNNSSDGLYGVYYVDGKFNAELSTAQSNGNTTYKATHESFANAYNRYQNNKATDDDFKTLITALNNDYISYNEKGKSTKFSFGTVALTNTDGTTKECDVAGVFAINDYQCWATVLGSKTMLDSFEIVPDNASSGTSWRNIETTDYKKSGNEKYKYAITNTKNSVEQTRFVMTDQGTYRYNMANTTYTSITFFTELILILKTAFLIAGIVLAAFSALMLLNYISASISTKKKEIGVLRAVGARGSDVFKIFFTESGIIAAICVILAIIASYATCYFLNNIMLTSVMGMELLEFGPINGLIIIAVGLVIALLGTFFPVWRESKKPPVAAIRSL